MTTTTTTTTITPRKVHANTTDDNVYDGAYAIMSSKCINAQVSQYFAILRPRA